MGADDEEIPLLFLLLNQRQLGIVHQMPRFQGFDKIGVVPILHPYQRQQLVFLFPIALGLGQDDHIFGVTDALKIGHGDGIRDPAVQQLQPVDLHHLRHHRKGGRRPDPIKPVICSPAVFVVDRLPALHVRAGDIKRRRVPLKGVKIEHIQLQRYFVVTELRVEQVPRLQKGAHPAIALVLAVVHVVTERTPPLPRLVIDAEGRTCGDADDAVKPDAGFHHHVHHTRAEQPAHTAAFQYQSRFHFVMTTFPSESSSGVMPPA